MSNANELAPKLYGVVIVHGPMASGKTYNSKELMRHFGCTRLVDSWEGQKLQPGDLALTCNEPPFHIQGATVLDIRAALSQVRAGRRR